MATENNPNDKAESGSLPDRILHDYRDYSNEIEVNGPLEDEEEQATLVQRHAQSFPSKLHYMLSEVDSDGLEHIVSWQPHGRCFLVRDQSAFVDQILPLWFRQSKFPSFQRQLNLYGFKRLTTGRDKGSYYHELFLRSKRFLAFRIQRIKIKGEGARKPSAPELEPNFYSIAYLPELVTRRPTIDSRLMPFGANGHLLGMSPNMAGLLPHQPGLMPVALPSLAHLAFQQQQVATQMALAPMFGNGASHLANVYQNQLWPGALGISQLQHQQYPNMQGFGPVGQQGGYAASAADRQDGAVAGLQHALRQGTDPGASLAAYLRK